MANATGEMKIRRTVEAQPPQTEDELRAIVDNAPVFLWSDLPDGNCDFLNRPWLNYFNLSLEEAQGTGWATLLHPDDAAHHLESRQKSISAGVPFETEARFRRPDGEYRWFLTRANPLRDKTGRIVKWYGTNIDIENLKRTERRLRQSETNLAEAQRLSRTGSWALRPATTKILYWSEECYRIWGFDPAHGLPSRETVWRRIHPDDRERVLEEAEHALREKRDYSSEFSMAAGIPFQYELRLRRFDGEYRWFDNRGRFATTPGTSCAGTSCWWTSRIALEHWRDWIRCNRISPI
jgi:PAS domain S-box-containing protein